MSLSEEEYVHGQLWARTLAILAERIPAREMLAHVALSESVAPILHPTAYRAGAERLEIVKRYLEATAQWKEAARAFLVDWEKTEPAAARAREDLRRDAVQHPEAAAISSPPEAAERN